MARFVAREVAMHHFRSLDTQGCVRSKLVEGRELMNHILCHTPFDSAQGERNLGSIRGKRDQIKGSILLVSLVMLLVITVAGLTSVKMATLEEKMSGNYQDQQMAFYAAEAALKEAENFIANNELGLSGFTAACNNGYCFIGSDIDDVGSCDPGVAEPWQTAEIWSDSGQHRVTTVSISGVSARAKYIIEFRCYVARESQGPLPDPANRGDWALYYRITALATGGSGDSRVMLQSSYKKNS